MKFLVIGVGGQVGSKVAQFAQKDGAVVVGTFRSRPVEQPGLETFPLDKTDRNAVDKVIGRVRPDVVVDTGAIHNVDFCESHPAEAMAVNCEGTGFVADAAHRVGARFVFVSTDYVFDGSGHPPYSEQDPTHPQSVYARSKLEAETRVLAPQRDCAVARPSVIYSWTPMEAAVASSSGKPLNFGSWFVRQLLAGKEVRIVVDQVA
jgi:dTDP-4-dehydrorhamnose reductase